MTLSTSYAPHSYYIRKKPNGSLPVDLGGHANGNEVCAVSFREDFDGDLDYVQTSLREKLDALPAYEDCTRHLRPKVCDCGRAARSRARDLTSLGFHAASSSHKKPSPGSKASRSASLPVSPTSLSSKRVCLHPQSANRRGEFPTGSAGCASCHDGNAIDAADATTNVSGNTLVIEKTAPPPPPLVTWRWKPSIAFST